jgi:anaerobic magnesium-protoporphyrin IX monomethyl ester cyclase
MIGLGVEDGAATLAEGLAQKSKADYRVALVCVHGTHWMASRYIHALVKSHGYDAHTVFFRETFEQVLAATRAEVQTCARTIMELKPDVVGFNVTSMGYRECVAITQELRRMGLKAPVIWGGTHATLKYRECLEAHPEVNYLCRGEGDEALPELLEALRTGADATAIPNIYVNRPEGLIENLPRPLRQELDDLPWNDYDDDNKHFIIQDRVYHGQNPIPFQQHTYYINTARGCPFRCTFCGNSALADKDNGKGRYLRRRSIESVIAEIKEARRRYPKIDFIFFWDDVFTAYPKWVLEFCEAYEREVGLPFFCYTHPEMITEKLMNALVKAGLKKLTMGIESGSYRVRSQIMSRFETNENIIKASVIQAGRGVDPSYDFILSDFEDDTDKEEGLELALALQKPFKSQMHTMTYYPGYPITEHAIAAGHIQPGDVVGASDGQRRTQSMYAEDLKRDAYINYFFLTGKPWLPHELARVLFEAEVHKTHPELLVRGVSALRLPLKLANMAGNYLRYVKHGHFSYLAILMRSYRSFLELHVGRVERQETYECEEIHDRFGAPV